DRVARAGLDDGARDPAQERLAEAGVLDVDRVDRPQRRAVRGGHLVRVVPGPALPLLHHAHVAVRLDEAGQDPPAARVDHGDTVRDLDVGPERGDHTVPDEDRPGEGLTDDGDDVTADDGEVRAARADGGRVVAHGSIMTRARRRRPCSPGPPGGRRWRARPWTYAP